LRTFTQFGTTGNYRAIAILHTLQFTVVQARGFSVFPSRILATDFTTVALSFQLTHEVFMAQSDSLLAISSQSLSTAISRTLPKSRLQLTVLLDCYVSTASRLLTVPSYNSLVRTPRKTPSSVFMNAFLLVRYLAMDVLFLSAFVAGMCLPTRCLAMVYTSQYIKLSGTYSNHRVLKG
jgi:hypothetical protein